LRRAIHPCFEKQSFLAKFSVLNSSKANVEKNLATLRRKELSVRGEISHKDQQSEKKLW